MVKSGPTMSETTQRVSSPMPVSKSETHHHQLSNNNSDSPDKLYLRSDCFGLGSFLPATELRPEIGDLIQIDRVLYTDWALCTGEDRVVHVSGVDQDNNEIPSGCAVVRQSTLAEVAGSNGLRVNNKIVGAKERNLEPLSVEKVIQNSHSCLDKEVEFNMLTRNSEHYVTEWKYGTGWSDQAAVTMSVMKTLSADCNVGHNVLVSGLNAVLNSPGSPARERSALNFSYGPDTDEKK